MRRIMRILGIALVVLLVLVLVVPLLIPIPPLDGTQPPEALADPDSCFMDVDGVRLHYKDMGQGEPALILLHGFAASVFSWREVMAPLSQQNRVIAFDRPAFGLTQRPLPGEWKGKNPYAAQTQVDLTMGLMDALGVRQAVLVGNSAGGTVAMLTALRYPDRVRALILVSPAVYSGGGASGFMRLLIQTPQASRLGVLLARQFRSFGESFGRMAWHDPSRLTPEIWAGYTRPLQADNWDRGLWEFVKAGGGQSGLAAQLNRLTMPVLVITGDDDRIVPTAQSVRLAGELPNAQLVVVPESGHVAHEETPDAFLTAARQFLTSLR